MKKRVLIILIMCFSIFLLISCNKDNTTNSIEDETKEIGDNQGEEINSEENNPVQENPREEVEENKINIFPNNKEYDGIKTKTITIQGEEKTMNFIEFRYTAYGMYVTDLINIVEFEDGTELQLDNSRQTINLIPFDIKDEINNFEETKKLAEEFIKTCWVNAPVTKEEGLQQYNEYLGSMFNDYGKREDYFLYYYNTENSAIILLAYFEKDKDRVLPIFLEEIKNIKYIDNIAR